VAIWETSLGIWKRLYNPGEAAYDTHLSDIVREIGLLKSAIRKAGLDEEEFLKLLKGD
jgi:hypothetical protein